jgi:hypothetical protein
MQFSAQTLFANIVEDELQQAILGVDSGFHNETILFGMVTHPHTFLSRADFRPGAVSSGRRRIQWICKNPEISLRFLLMTTWEPFRFSGPVSL